MDKLIQSILTTKRCHNSKGEIAFLAWLHNYIKTLGHTVVPLAEGCTTVKIGKNGARTLFSCHIDTCHSAAESDGSMQSLVFDESFQHIFLGDKTSGCLGADDGAGIYIMLRMMEAKVEGTYIFHRGEEKSGIGARAMLIKHASFLEEFDRSIAFDRPGNSEVIITQGGLVCASPEFGKQLSEALTKGGLKYENSVKGVFTDNKVYRQIIPCNVNLGVGYLNQHTNQEYQDWDHLSKLTDIAIELDWESLKPVRKIVDETVYMPPSSQAWKSQPKHHDFKGYDFPESSFPFSKEKKKNSKPSKNTQIPYKKQTSLSSVPTLSVVEELEQMTYDDILDWCSGGDSVDIAEAFKELLVILDMERAKSNRYAQLLGD